MKTAVWVEVVGGARAFALAGAIVGLGVLASGCGSPAVLLGALDLAGQPDAAPSGCKADTDCTAAAPRCEPSTQKCQPCLPEHDNCAPGSHCTVAPTGYACVVGCQAASDCASDAGALACCGSACVDTRTDVHHCGACGAACPAYANGSARCVAGVCGIGACAPGYADCNGLADDGCEVDLKANPAHCGACATVCPPAPGGTPACEAGACVVQCNTNQLHCSKNPADGCEVNGAVDLQNCGACGHPCGPLPHGTPGCVGGGCRILACDAGYADCDNSAADGCEVGTQADVNNCGACGAQCPGLPHGSPMCHQGSCLLGSCEPGYADCDGLAQNGCEAHIDVDAANCGSCGRLCAGPNATYACQAGACVVSTCTAGYAHCSMNPTDGCEVHVSDDAKNCGGCGLACPVPANATATCVNAQCGVGQCAFGYADCDQAPGNGCEANLLQTTSCGACGVICAAQQHAAVACIAGSCGLGACDPLYANCDGVITNGCERAIGNDVQNCGGCAVTCTAPFATVACLGGVCGLTGCVAGHSDCDKGFANGCEVATGTDTNNCGACGAVCSAPPNSAPACSASMCTTACNPGYADCDHAVGNGCETNVLASLGNCGVCGNTCAAVANGLPGCTQGTCGIASCNTAYGDCDNNPQNGCEKALAADITNCGKCGNRCVYANATPICLGGVCGRGACNTGYLDCNSTPADGCEVTSLTDAKNCGACGNACPMAKPTCVNGACGATQLVVGFDSANATDTLYAPGYLLGMRVTVPRNMTVTALGSWMLPTGGGPHVVMGLYNDNGAAHPGTLVAATASTVTVANRNLIPLTAPATITAGNYWIMAVYDATAHGAYAAAGGTITVNYMIFAFSPNLPANFGTAVTYQGTTFAYFLVGN